MFIVCGQKAWNSEKLGELCRSNPHDEVYALPWIDSQDALVDNMKHNGGRPNYFWPVEKDTDIRDGEFQEFDDSLGSDALGRMAHLVARGMRVKNEIMKASCRTPFYRKVISRSGTPASSFLVSNDDVGSFFPRSPLSARLYAAVTVPVRLKATDKFTEATGFEAEFVDVIVATDLLPGSMTFLKFYKLISGLGFVALDEYSKIYDSVLPVFTYNRGYRTASGAENVTRTL